MNSAIYRLTLDVLESVSREQIEARRGDTLRELYLTLTEGRTPYRVAQGCAVELAALRPDGSKVLGSCAVEDNGVRCRLPAAAVQLAGQVQCELRVYDGLGGLLTSAGFEMIVTDTLYHEGDPVVEIPVSGSTVKSIREGFAEVYMWSDGNPDGENRTGRFVKADTGRSSAMIALAGAGDAVLGVAVEAPGFAAQTAFSRFDDNGCLEKSYSYVTLLGHAKVTDNGSCTVNGFCRPGPDGVAKAAEEGFLVVSRVDDAHVTVFMDRRTEPKEDLLVSAALSTAWVGDAAPYTQVVAVPGVTAEDRPHVAPVYDDAPDLALAQQAGWGLVSDGQAGNGSITFRCLEEKPAVSIPIEIEVRR